MTSAANWGIRGKSSACSRPLMIRVTAPSISKSFLNWCNRRNWSSGWHNWKLRRIWMHLDLHIAFDRAVCIHRSQKHQTIPNLKVLAVTVFHFVLRLATHSQQWCRVVALVLRRHGFTCFCKGHHWQCVVKTHHSELQIPKEPSCTCCSNDQGIGVPRFVESIWIFG